MKKDAAIIDRVKNLCIAGDYDRAIKLTNEISDRHAAIEAHLLCMEHEAATKRQKAIKGIKTMKPDMKEILSLTAICGAVLAAATIAVCYYSPAIVAAFII